MFSTQSFDQDLQGTVAEQDSKILAMTQLPKARDLSGSRFGDRAILVATSFTEKLWHRFLRLAVAHISSPSAGVTQVCFKIVQPEKSTLAKHPASLGASFLCQSVIHFSYLRRAPTRKLSGPRYTIPSTSKGAYLQARLVRKWAWVKIEPFNLAT